MPICYIYFGSAFNGSMSSFILQTHKETLQNFALNSGDLLIAIVTPQNFTPSGCMIPRCHKNPECKNNWITKPLTQSFLHSSFM